MLSTTDVAPSVIKTGLHIYMGGLGVQLFFILVFFGLGLRFQGKLQVSSDPEYEDQLPMREYIVRPNRHSTSPAFPIANDNYMRSPVRARELLMVLYSVLALIVGRVVYRLIEFNQGVTSVIPTHEAFPFVFDSVPMFFALVLFNIWHPGRYLVGPGSSLEKKSRKQKKAEKIARKEAKRAGKVILFHEAR